MNEPLLFPSSGNKNKEKTFFTVYLVKSAPENFDRRITIRATWGRYRSIFNKKLILVVFMIGLHPSDDGINRTVRIESKCYNDILRSNVMNTFGNLTQKSLSTFEWITLKMKQKAKFFIVTDDNCVVDIIATTNFLSHYLSPGNETTSAMYCGFMFERLSGVIRGNSKLSLTRGMYPETILPSFCRGAMVILTYPMINDLQLIAKTTNYTDFPLEDIMIYGILRAKLGTDNIQPVINGGIPLVYYPWDDTDNATTLMKLKWRTLITKLDTVATTVRRREKCHKRFVGI